MAQVSKTSPYFASSSENESDCYCHKFLDPKITNNSSQYNKDQNNSTIKTTQGSPSGYRENFVRIYMSQAVSKGALGACACLNNHMYKIEGRIPEELRNAMILGLR